MYACFTLNSYPHPFEGRRKGFHCLHMDVISPTFLKNETPPPLSLCRCDCVSLLIPYLTPSLKRLTESGSTRTTSRSSRYIQYIMYRYTCIHIEKEERSKQGQTKNKAKQHSTPKAVTFPDKNELLQVGLEPTTLYTRGLLLHV